MGTVKRIATSIQYLATGSPSLIATGLPEVAAVLASTNGFCTEILEIGRDYNGAERREEYEVSSVDDHGGELVRLLRNVNAAYLDLYRTVEPDLSYEAIQNLHFRSKNAYDLIQALDRYLRMLAGQDVSQSSINAKVELAVEKRIQALRGALVAEVTDKVMREIGRGSGGT